MGIHIEVPKEKVAAFCRRNHIRSFALFGSVLRANFEQDSDVDVLVEFEVGKEPDLMDLVRMEIELTEMFGRKVDLVERQSVERSENYIRRRHILQFVEAVYVA